MTTEHDEQLVERVALALRNLAYDADPRGRERTVKAITDDNTSCPPYWFDQARAVIYPPAPPKTRLQVARELLAKGYEWRDNRENNPSYGPDRARNGYYDNNAEIHAVLAALALPAMED